VSGGATFRRPRRRAVVAFQLELIDSTDTATHRVDEVVQNSARRPAAGSPGLRASSHGPVPQLGLVWPAPKGGDARRHACGMWRTDIADRLRTSGPASHRSRCSSTTVTPTTPQRRCSARRHDAYPSDTGTPAKQGARRGRIRPVRTEGAADRARRAHAREDHRVARRDNVLPGDQSRTSPRSRRQDPRQSVRAGRHARTALPVAMAAAAVAQPRCSPRSRRTSRSSCC